jgi:CHAT domain
LPLAKNPEDVNVNNREAERVCQALEVSIMTNRLDLAEHARLLLRLARRGLMVLKAFRRPALGDNPAAGVTRGDEHDFEISIGGSSHGQCADLSGSIPLGARTTVPEVEQLSQKGALADYRIVHFATHGALSGQVTGSSEPGLVMTPPDAAVASKADDGYLSASGIAALKLDADWVILSACNTAAGGAKEAEALSGLARAFYYAGARALLVSHWSVSSGPTVKLVTGALHRLTEDSKLGRAEAMRQSMLALIDHGSDYEIQPAVWAPFVVVGEGAPAR